MMLSSLVWPVAAGKSFPAIPEPTGDPIATTRPDTEASRPIVLLVEDNLFDVKVISRALQQCGLELDLQISTQGEHALSLLSGLDAGIQHRPPSLILLDWNLPMVSGSEVLGY